MDITVGLDFGTHQTKVCLSYRPNIDTLYKFLEFEKPDGGKTLFLPSVIQINEDNTISIGFTDRNRCKEVPVPKPVKPGYPEEPSLIKPAEPKKTYPPQPILKKDELDWKQKLAQSLNGGKEVKDPAMEAWKTKCAQIDEKWARDYALWLAKCKDIEDSHCNWLQDVQDIDVEYNERLSEWAKKQSISQRFFYFKLAALTGGKWSQDYIIKPDYLCVWYLTYVLLIVRQQVEREFGADFDTDVSVQMGIPMSIEKNRSNKVRERGKSLLKAARELCSVFDSPDDFCSQLYIDLLDFTEIPVQVSDDEAMTAGLLFIPEAFAGLQSLTQTRRLKHGDMHLLVDIGGGTTDVAFFTVRDSLTPDIHCVQSFHYGLNYVLETFCQHHPEYSMSDAQELFMIEKRPFDDSVRGYTELLKRKLEDMLRYIIGNFEECRRGVANVTPEVLTAALHGRPIVFCGGGSMHEPMRIVDTYFTDRKVLDRNMLNITNLQNTGIDTALYPILATSYGLSIPLLSTDTIEMTDIPELFKSVINKFLVENGHETYFNDHSEYGVKDD